MRCLDHTAIPTGDDGVNLGRGGKEDAPWNQHFWGTALHEATGVNGFDTWGAEGKLRLDVLRFEIRKKLLQAGKAFF